MEHITTRAVTAQGRTHRRVIGIGLAILFQAGFVYALVAGLEIKIPVKLIDPFTFVPIRTAPVKPPENPPTPREVEPERVVPVIPTVVIDEPPPQGGGTALTPDHGRLPAAGPLDRGPLAIMATHTIPPYPPLDMRLGHQGTVVLRLTISPTGAVTDAVVVRSSGSDSLDAAARAWVVAHWRYQPAIRGGTAVPATSTVAVEFNLRNAG